MTTPGDFGINLNSSSYTNSTVNPFVAVGNPTGVPVNRNWLWCTEFAFGRAVEKGLINANSGVGKRIRGHANQWDDQAGTWSSQPRANSFIVWERTSPGDQFGHVAFVERVNPNGSIVITEGNYNWNGWFNSRTLSPAQFQGTKFIHLGGGATPTPPPQQPPSSGQVWRGSEGPDFYQAPGTNDTLIGNGGNDTLFGEAGNDYLVGGNGNDYLDGYASFTNADFDTLEGGAGIDTFVLGNTRQGTFYRGNGHAVIRDYNPADDYIQLSGAASSYRLSVVGADTHVQLTNGDLIAVIQNRTDMSLSPRPGRVDFKFV
jgi:Ca2+-binding RTX toxin-like protein